MADAPLVEVYDKTLQRRGILGTNDWRQLTVTLNHLGVSTVILQAPWATATRVPALLEPGCRLVVSYWGRVIVSGTVTKPSGQGPSNTGGITLQVVSDNQLLFGTLMWPNPLAAITAQPDYWRRTGTLENVTREAITRNVRDRLGAPIATGTNLERGPTVNVSARFNTIADKILPLFNRSGLGVELVQDPHPAQFIRLRFYETRTVPQAITEQSGALASWSWELGAPEVTRGVVGGAGGGAARRLLQSTVAASETLWGFKAETFVDARDLQVDTSNTDLDTQAKVDAALLARLQERYDEGGPRGGLSVTLAETERYQVHPDQLWLGDTVTVETLGGIARTDWLRQIVLTWGPEGYRAEPAVGEPPENGATRLVRQFGQLARRIRSAGPRQ